MKSMLSAYLSLSQSVSSTFFIEVDDYFSSDFFNEVTLFLQLKNDSLIFTETSLLLVFGEEVPKIRYFASFLVNFVILFSSKHFERRIIVILDFSSKIP